MPTPSPAAENISTPSPSPESDAQSTPEPTMEPKDWSGVKDAFLITLTELQTQESGEGKLQMEISFPKMEQDQVIRPGDEAVFALPVELMEVEDSEEPMDIVAFVPRDEESDETEDPQQADPQQADDTEKEISLEVVLAQYEITDGEVHITFAEGIAEETVQAQLDKIYGKLDLEFRWKDGVRTEQPQTVDWLLQRYEDETENKVSLEIPALVLQATPTPEPSAEPTPEPSAEPTPEPSEESTPEPAEEPRAEDGESQTEEPVVQLFALNADSPLNGLTKLSYEGKSEEQHIYWIDNNNGQLTRPQYTETLTDETLGNLTFSANFTYKDAAGIEQTISYNDLTWNDVKGDAARIQLTDLGGTGHWVLSANGLPSSATIEIEGRTYNGTFSDWGIEQDYHNMFLADNEKYSVVSIDGVNEAGVPVDQNGLERPSAGDARGWFYVQKETYTAEIVVRAGSAELDEEKVKEAVLDSYSFRWKTGILDKDGNDINAGALELTDTEGWINLDWGGSGEFLTAQVTLRDLEKYNLDGSEIIYYINGNDGDPVTISNVKALEKEDATNSVLDQNDTLEESIVNDSVSNWGTNTTEVYSGGDLFLTLSGTTDYTATKEWHDKEDSTNRPQLDFYLWRFTDKGQDITDAYQTAAPVKATKGAYNGQNAQFTIEAKSQESVQQIDFTSNFEEVDATGAYLPKYDPEGYPYVYISREYMSGEGASRYRTEYGKLNLQSGLFEDTLPEEYNLNGGGNRTTLDNSIYNGGTVSNVLTGTTAANVTKIWVANAFQSEFSDVEIELTLYSKPAKDDSAAWEATSTVYRMGQDTPFIAEFLTQSHSASMPKYNNEGVELQYCWVETGIFQNSNPDVNLLDEGGTIVDKSFTLSQNGQSVAYTSTSEYTKNADGTYSTSITNRIKNETEYYVEKTWDSTLEPAPVELILGRTNAQNQQQVITMQNGKNFALDGEVDAEPTDLYYQDQKVGQVQETQPWFAEFTRLDLYDGDGSMFDYIVFEGYNNRWEPEYSTRTDEEGRTIFVIRNVPPPGGVTTLLLRKHWLDDGDEQHRGTVTFTVYQVQEGVETTAFTAADLKELGSYELDRSDNWWRKVTVNTENADRLLVLETSVASTDEGTEPVSLQYSDEEMRTIFALQHTRDGTEINSPIISYETYYHQYEASYSMVEFHGNWFYTVTNRRLGNIDIEVTKTWIDGSTDNEIFQQRNTLVEAIQNAGGKLVLQLICNSSGVNINYVTNTVTAGNKTVPILNRNDEPAQAIQSLNTQSNTSTYDFHNLPKYDGYGRLISYTVKEMVLDKDGHYREIALYLQDNGIQTEYSFTMTQSGYVVQHGQDKHDLQTFDAVNRLSGQKDVFFWKEWNDAYRFQHGERPDLYLSLYKVEHDKDGKPTNPQSLYLDRRWQFRDNAISLCDFDSMPKYDANGYEIIYYAQEKILVNKDAFDYTDVYYKYSEKMEDKEVLRDEQLNQTVNALTKIGDEKTVVQDSGAPESAMVQSDDGIYLLKECGIFVNELQADVTVNGKKIWANLPSGFLAEDLPQVTFQLYRYDPRVDTNIPEEDAADDSFDPGHLVATLTITDWPSQKIDGEYHFALAYEGINTNERSEDGKSIEVSGNPDQPLLAKYNEEGYLYTYILRETAVDFTGSEAGNVNLVFKQPTVNNYALTNGYDSPLGIISVKKILNQKTLNGAQKKNAAVSFTLTRSYTVDGKADGTLRQDTTFSRTITIKVADFKDGSATIDFENLEIYAPNGSKYRYTVTENVGESQLLQGGYTVYAETGKQDQVTVAVGEDHAVTNLFPWQTTDAKPGQVLPEQRPDNEKDTSWATFENVYNPDIVPLYFGKAWTDQNNIENARLKELSFTLSRRANTQVGQNNAIGLTKLGTLKMTLSDDDFTKDSVTLTKDHGLTLSEDMPNTIESVTISSLNDAPLRTTEKWLIKVESVDDYAPNGMPWIYTVEEEIPAWPYTASTRSTTLTYTAPADGNSQGYFGNPNSPAYITNTMNVSTMLWKNWRDGSEQNKAVPNPFGYAIKLEASLYLAGVPVTGGNEPSDAAFNNASLWKAAADSEFEEELLAYLNKTEKDLKKTINYGKGGSLTSKNNATSVTFPDLPALLTVDGTVYAMRYYVIETGFSLLNEQSKEIYREEFTPQFRLMSEEELSDDYKGSSRVGYWLQTTAKIWNGNELTSTEECLVTPRIDSEEDLEKACKSFGEVFDQKLDNTSDLSVWPLVNYNTSKRESTAINDLDLTELTVTKTWENDHDNVYGTRQANGNGKWKLTFQLQRADQTVSAPADSEWENVGNTQLTLTGDNKPAQGATTPQGTFDYLPVQALEGDYTDGYKIVSYQYRAREIDDQNGNQVVLNGTYHDSYKVDYSDGGTQEEGFATQATNALQTVDFHAQKTWKLGDDTWDNGWPVTLELKYQKKDGTYASFATPATVTVDGIAATNDEKADAYYADEWKAVWQGVPKVMPGSTTTGTGVSEQTIYKVFEVDNNSAYGLSSGSLADATFAITNEPTQLKVEKIVLDYGTGGTFEQKFTFTLTDGVGNKVTDSNGAVFYQVFKADGTAIGQLETLKTGEFKLQNGQYAIFYGLKKGEDYTITETDTCGFTPTYQVTYADETQGAIGNKVTIPAEKPSSPPTVSVQNTSMGKLTVQKKDDADKPLAGVTFTLQRTDRENPTEDEWETVGQAKTTDVNGQVVFDKLDLGYTYRIVETSVPTGYNILKDPIVIALPYGTKTNPAWGQKAWVSVTDAESTTYYYTDVTVAVGNNKVLVAPTTGGSGVFWPGVGGLALVGLGAIFYLYSAGKRKKRKYD